MSAAVPEMNLTQEPELLLSTLKGALQDERGWLLPFESLSEREIVQLLAWEQKARGALFALPLDALKEVCAYYEEKLGDLCEKPAIVSVVNKVIDHVCQERADLKGCTIEFGYSCEEMLFFDERIKHLVGDGPFSINLSEVLSRAVLDSQLSASRPPGPSSRGSPEVIQEKPRL